MPTTPRPNDMDKFDAPPLSKSSTYHIVAQDEYDPSVKLAPEKRMDATERPSLSTSYSSASSITLTDKRHSTKSLANMHKKRKKPLAGDRALKALRQVPLFFKAAAVIILTGIPFAIFTVVAYTKYADTWIGQRKLDVSLRSLAIYLEIGWATMLVILCLAENAARFFSWLCKLCTATTRYAPMAHTMMYRVTLMLWIGAMRLATCQMWPMAMQTGLRANWVFGLRQGLEFLAIAALILVVQGMVVQSIAIQYVQGYIGPRSENAMNELLTLQQLDKLLRPRMRDDKARVCGDMLNKLFAPRKECIFDAIRKGKCCNEEVRGYAAILWMTVAGNAPTITLLDIYEHLVLLKRETDGAADLFSLLDRFGHGIVSRQEFEDLVLQVALQLKKRAAAMHGITLLLRKLEIVFSLVVLGAIIFVYTAFFKSTAASNIASLWTGIVALQIAFASPIAEFVNSCVWVFARHSYDVGDKVVILERTLLVRHIYLTHTIFEEHLEAKKQVVQISHTKMSGEPLVNVTRSEDPMEEYMAGSVSNTPV